MTQILEREDRPHDVRDPRAGRPPRWVAPAVVALTLLALGVRCLVGLHSGLWRDEALFLFVVGEPSWGDMLDFLRQHESHPPLFYAVMRVWLSLTGDSDAAAMAVPIALGAALVPALHVVGSRLMSWRVGLIAAAAAAVSPIAVEFGAEVRPYSLLPLLALLSTALLARAVDAGGRAWVGYTVTTLALVYTHNWAWLVLAGQWAAVAACLRHASDGARGRTAGRFLASQAAVALGFLPWLPVFLHQLAHAGHGPNPLFIGTTFSQDPLSTLLVLVSGLFIGTLVPQAGVALVALTFGAVATTVAAVTLLARRERGGSPSPRPRTVLTMLVVVPVVALSAAAVLSVRSDALPLRCLATLAPLLLLLLAHGLDRIWQAGWRVVTASALAALLVGYGLHLADLYEAPRSRARELATRLAARVAPDDLLVVSPWWLASAVNRYYRPGTSQIDFPALQRVGATPFDDVQRRFADPAAFDAARERLEAAHAAGVRVWWVSQSNDDPCEGAACAEMIEHPPFAGSAAGARTVQLRTYLEQLYGAPDCDTRSFTGRYDDLVLCRFEVR